MTNQEIITFVRKRTNSTSSTLSDDELLTFINERNRQLFAALQSVREDYGGERSTTDLVASQQEYALPDDCMRLKRLEVKLDGKTWNKVEFFDIGQHDNANDEVSIRSTYTKDKPFADVLEDGLFLYPIPDTAVTDGLKLWYIKRPQDNNDLGGSQVLPKEHHMYIVELTTIDAEVSKGRMAVTTALNTTREVIDIFTETVAPRNDDQLVMIGRNKRQNYR